MVAGLLVVGSGMRGRVLDVGVASVREGVYGSLSSAL
jgi:hypothetical protein